MFTRAISSACLTVTGWIFIGAGVLYGLAALAMPLHGMAFSPEPFLATGFGVAGGAACLFFAKRILGVSDGQKP